MSNTLPLVSVGEVVARIECWDPINSSSKEPFPYIDISSVDREVKEVFPPPLILPEDAPSRAKQLVKANDVIVSTVRPNLNAVAHVQKELDGATASTGFCVLRANDKKLNSRYLYFWVRSPEFIGEMTKRATGASYPAVSDGIIKSSKIPLPPLDEQRRIAAILDKADAIRRKRQESIRLTEEFLRSTFLEMFGDPVTNPKGLKTGLLGDYCDMETGFAFKSDTFQETGIKLCRGANVLPGEIEWSDVKFWSNEDQIAERYVLREGDVVLAMDRPWISSGLKVARVSNSDLPSYLVQRVARLRGIKGLSNEFIYFCIKHPSFTKHCKPKITETTVPHISPLDIRSHQILIPDIKSVETFSRVANKILQTELKLQNQTHITEYFFNSLTHRAFRGEL